VIVISISIFYSLAASVEITDWKLELRLSIQEKKFLYSYRDCFNFCCDFFDVINLAQAICIVKIFWSEVQVLDRNLKKKIKLIR
jgi:hypothetical protein